MKLRSLLFLFLSSVAMGAYLYWGIQKPSEQKEAQKDKEGLLIKGDLNQLEKLSLQTLGQKIELQRTDHSSKTIWKITTPINDLASSSKIDNFISAAGRFKKTKTIASGAEVEQDPSKISQFSLNPPKLKLEIKTKESGDIQQILLGGNNPSMTGSYAQLNAKGEVVLASMDLDFLASQVIDDFREMRLTTVDSQDFSEVSIENGKSKIKFARDSNQNWIMVAPFSQLPVDSEFIRSEIQKISFIRANRFLEKIPDAILKPDFRVIVGFKENVSDDRSDHNDKRPAGVEIIFGKSAKKLPQTAAKPQDPSDAFEYYAKSDKTQSASIARFHYDNFSKPAESYIRKTFDVFDIQKVKSAKWVLRGAPEISISKDRDDFWISQKNEKEKADPSKVEAALSSLRSLRAVKFEKIPVSIPMTQDLSAQIEMEDGRKMTFVLRLDKDFADLWFQDQAVKMQYLMNKNPIELKNFEYSSLVQSEPKDNAKPNELKPFDKKPEEKK